MMKKVLAAAVAVGALLTVATVASADHSWNGYHWPSDNLSPTVVDKTRASLYDVPAGVLEWADLAIDSTDIQPTLTTARKGNITVSGASSQQWLGLARIFLEEGHITKGEVRLNTQYLAYYESNGYPGIADQVLCQEIGHVLGLGHNRTQNDTCMNDQAFVGPDLTSPNQHDAEQLNDMIYDGHTDATGGGEEKGSGGGGCKGGPKKCGQGVWITVHVFPLP